MKYFTIAIVALGVAGIATYVYKNKHFIFPEKEEVNTVVIDEYLKRDEDIRKKGIETGITNFRVLEPKMLNIEKIYEEEQANAKEKKGDPDRVLQKTLFWRTGIEIVSNAHGYKKFAFDNGFSRFFPNCAEIDLMFDDVKAYKYKNYCILVPDKNPYIKEIIYGTTNNDCIEVSIKKYNGKYFVWPLIMNTDKNKKEKDDKALLIPDELDTAFSGLCINAE